MPSPFPGMDPFLEGPEWLDFHSRFVNTWCEAVADGLPDEYVANIDERVYLVEVDPDTRKLIYPDVSVSQREMATSTSPHSALATAEPMTIPLEIIEGPRETYIEILKKPELSLVAVLELLSPANKENPGRTEYLSKRNAVLRQNVHLVELDLLLGGQRVPMGKSLPAGDYYYILARAEERFDAKVYRWTIADALPCLPVPLRPPHADVMVDLATVFTTAYERGRFGRRLHYDRPCPAALRDEQRTWVDAIAKSRVKA